MLFILFVRNCTAKLQVSVIICAVDENILHIHEGIKIVCSVFNTAFSLGKRCFVVQIILQKFRTEIKFPSP